MVIYDPLHQRSGCAMPGAATAPSTTERRSARRCWPTAMSFGWATAYFCIDRPESRLATRRPHRLIGHRRRRHACASGWPRSPSRGSLILFLGETGTGKEVAARVHDPADRARRLWPSTARAVPETLAESQLFGHTKGAFTGAQAHPGFFRAAGDGTPLLDEIGDLQPSPQPKPCACWRSGWSSRWVGQRSPLLARLLFSTNCNPLDAVRLEVSRRSVRPHRRDHRRATAAATVAKTSLSCCSRAVRASRRSTCRRRRWPRCCCYSWPLQCAGAGRLPPS